MVKRGLHILFSLAILVFLVHCEKKQIIPTENVVARVNNTFIEWNELYQSYHLDSKWSRGMTRWESYMNQLQYLIDQKLFALEFEKRLPDTDPDIQKTLQFIKEKEMVKALFAKHVWDKITISEKDYQTAYLRSKSKIQLEYIIGKDPRNLVKYKEMLKNKSVDEIPLMDPKSEEKGKTPWFTYGDMAEEIENIAFELNPFEVSQVFRIENRYMVIKLVNKETQKFASETELAYQKPSLKKIIFERKSRPLTQKFVNKIMNGIKIHIDRQLFQRLYHLINIEVKNKIKNTPTENLLGSSELQNIAISMKDFFEAPLATYDGNQLTIKDFLDFYRIIPPKIKPPIHKPRLLRDAIIKLIEFDYLKNQAYKEGFDKDADVKKKSDIQCKEWLAFHYLKSVKKSVFISSKQIHAFKNSEKMQRLTQVLNRTPSDDQVQIYLENEQFMKRVQQLADSLRYVYKVKIFTSNLKKFIKNSSDKILYDPVILEFKEKFF